MGIPKLREGSYFPGLREPRRCLVGFGCGPQPRQEPLLGISTRSVNDLLKALGMSGI